MGLDFAFLIIVMVLGIFFDAALLIVVVVHIRYVSKLSANIAALEASTDILLESQRDLNKSILVYMNNV